MRNLVLLGGGYGNMRVLLRLLPNNFQDDMNIILVDRTPFHSLKTEFYALASGTSTDKEIRVKFPEHERMITMNNFFKKGLSALIAAVTLASSTSLFSSAAVNSQLAGADTSSSSSLMDDIKVNAGNYTIPELNISQQNIPDTEGINFVKDMRLGWNLGNTMDAIDDTGWVGSEMGIETCWNGNCHGQRHGNTSHQHDG